MMEYFANNNKGVDSLNFSPKIGAFCKFCYIRGMVCQSNLISQKERKKEKLKRGKKKKI